MQPGALARRLDAAARLYALRGDSRTIVVVSGGRRWGRIIEADAMAGELVLCGVPERAIVRERCSMSTRENALFGVDLLRRHGVNLDRTAVVTCEWHVARARALFSRAGAAVEWVGVPSAGASPIERLWQRGREGVLAWLALAFFLGCARTTPRPSPATGASDPSAEVRADMSRAVAKAEDMRRVQDVPAGAQRSHSPELRRRAARAFGRILAPDDAPLIRALEDEDGETVAWGAYGLGESCRGDEDGRVRALASRLASIDSAGKSAGDRIDPRIAIVRALGRCGGEAAEQTLDAWLAREDDTAEAAAYALGDIAARRGVLSAASIGALLDATRRRSVGAAALYPFGHIDPDALGEQQARLAAASRAFLEHAGPTRVFAIRALGRLGGAEGVAILARILVSGAFAPAERAEAGRSLGKLRATGQGALSAALASLVAERTVDTLAGDGYGVLRVALESLSQDPPKAAEALLWSLAGWEPPAKASPPIARRVSALRCAAAARLAKGDWDADVLRGCDVGDGEAGEDARLGAVDRGQLVGSRRSAWLDLARSKHVRVREAALEAIARHRELGDAAIPVLGEGLSSAVPGLVAKSADAVHALLPHDLDPRIAAALKGAMAHRWTADCVETRGALVDASLAAGVDGAVSFAEATCRDGNPTVRARAAKALAIASCPPPDEPIRPAAEVDHPMVRPTRVAFDTDAGLLAVRFDPALAPIAVTRLVALARSGFYTGIAIHRVVPGFVVQLGDRDGDGYGGSGDTLRCETSPVPFERLDVGVALAGRDTGSSQMFVTLARSPQLDGEYALVGQAEGDWDAVAEGDIVLAVRVED